jgi:hypothetical protein
MLNKKIIFVKIAVAMNTLSWEVPTILKYLYRFHANAAICLAIQILKSSPSFTPNPSNQFWPG